jgi:hypothetical protein
MKSNIFSLLILTSSKSIAQPPVLLPKVGRVHANRRRAGSIYCSMAAIV